MPGRNTPSHWKSQLAPTVRRCALPGDPRREEVRPGWSWYRTDGDRRRTCPRTLRSRRARRQRDRSIFRGPRLRVPTGCPRSQQLRPLPPVGDGRHRDERSEHDDNRDISIARHGIPCAPIIRQSAAWRIGSTPSVPAHPRRPLRRADLRPSLRVRARYRRLWRS